VFGTGLAIFCLTILKKSWKKPAPIPEKDSKKPE
jgi:hypothetical protein